MKVCRLCLSKLQRGSKYFNINAVESFTGFMPYRDQLTTCIPEMALDLIPNPVICNSCRTALKSSYDFKSRCLMIEKKIREYVEAQPPEVTMYDLNEIDGSDIPKLNTKFQISPEPQAAPGPPPLHPYSKLSELLTTNKDVMLPFQNKELEITNVTDNFSGNSTFDDSFDLTTCNVCMIKFDTVPALHQHKKDVHNEDYICNFCNESFRSLQCLRKHNYDCMKNKSPANRTTVLAKRPHLPTKAKNHLKRWLFRHTEHPYPTDHEKQQLMKETNLSLLQVENWFINARRRILADLTKLKNMRGRHIKRKRQDKDNNGDEDCEDLLDNDPDPLFEESFLFETESTPPRRGRAVRGRRRKIIPQPRPIPRKQPVSLPDNKDEEEAQAPKAPEEEETEEEEEMTARSTQELDGPPGLMRIKRENEEESIKLKEEHIDDEEEDIQEEEEEVQNEEEDKAEEEDEEEMPLTKIKMELEAGR